MLVLRSKRVELFFLNINAGLFFLANAMYMPVLPLLLRELGVSLSMVGIIIGATSFIALLAAVPSGIIIHKFGIKVPIILTCILSLLSCFMLFIFQTIPSLLINLSIYKLAELIFIVGAQTHVSNLSDSKRLDSDFGLYAMAASISQVFGPIISGFLVDKISFKSVWFFMGIIMIICTLLSFLTIKDISICNNKKNKFKISKFKNFINYISFLAILASFAVLFANDGTRTTYYPIYMKNIGYSVTITGIMMAIRAFASIAIRSFIGNFVRFVKGRFQGLAISIFSLAIGIGTIPFCKNIFTLSINSIFTGLGMGLAMPLSMSTVVENVKPEERSLAMSIRISGNRIANFFSPIFFGIISQFWGINISFIIGGILLLIIEIPLINWIFSNNKKASDYI